MLQGFLDTHQENPAYHRTKGLSKLFRSLNLCMKTRSRLSIALEHNPFPQWSQ